MVRICYCQYDLVALSLVPGPRLSFHGAWGACPSGASSMLAIHTSDFVFSLVRNQSRCRIFRTIKAEVRQQQEFQRKLPGMKHNLDCREVHRLVFSSFWPALSLSMTQ